ncbi:hypothetical protein KKG72_10660 [bacterium]|nr:hypothetical protein [bacterium]MBU1993146.1 hypothetical protein [bacterium]
MFKIVLSLTAVLLFSNVSASDYIRANSAAKESLKGLDCEFEDCKKEVPAPQVIIQEKIVIKEVPVEVEKVVYKERGVEAIPELIPASAVEKPSKAVAGRTYNKAFFDVHTKSQAPMLDYIQYTNRGSFDANQFADTVSKIKESDTKAYIHGSIAVPESITTDEVYLNVGAKYYASYYGWVKEIYYNNSTTRQNSDYFLVNVKKDKDGNRYVDYKIYILMARPWDVNAANESWVPNTFIFTIAPKTRGFKNQFIKAEPYIIEE